MVTFRGCTFNEEVLIDHAAFHREVDFISNCQFKKDLKVIASNLKSKFSFDNTKFDGYILLSSNNSSGAVSITNSVLDKYIIITSGQYKIIDFHNFTIFDKLEISKYLSVENLTINTASISRLVVDRLEYKISFIIDKRCKINTIDFYGVLHKDSSITISQELWNINFKDFTNYGTVTFKETTVRDNPSFPRDVNNEYFLSNLTKNPFIKIDNSDLGKTTFIDCDLSSFDFFFKSSKITEVFVIGTQMPKQITPQKDGIFDYEQRQQGYSQLKKIFESRGDRVQSNRYLANELDAYFHTLSFWNWKENGEYIILASNRISSFYGQNWGLAFWMTLAISVFCYYAYCVALGYYPLFLTEASFREFVNLSSYFLEYINPIHKADYIVQELDKSKGVEPDKIFVPASARLIEGVSRIVIAFFLYQLIQAFRKHGKSSS